MVTATRQGMRWLIYGVLPRCLGLPVRATDHLDRKRGILKGCKGTIVGWAGQVGSEAGGVEIWNKLPDVVYVKFDTAASWSIPGLPDANTYPVATCKRVWFLDRQRKNPQLRIWRTPRRVRQRLQLPRTWPKAKRL